MKILVLIAVLACWASRPPRCSAAGRPRHPPSGRRGRPAVEFRGGPVLMVLRPFKVGDMISAAAPRRGEGNRSVLTAIDTPDNVRVFVGNGKLLRRFDSELLDQPVPPRRAHGGSWLMPSTRRTPCSACASASAGSPTCWANPAPSVEILTFQSHGHGDRGAALLPQRPLLAGLLRHEPRDHRGGWRGRLSGSETRHVVRNA